ncbi:hypothetical protein ACET3Z_022071 [Daucus carota]
MASLITNLCLFLSLCVVSIVFAAPRKGLSSMISPAPSSTDEKWQPPSILAWNISGIYKGSWGLMDSKKSHSRSQIFNKSSGDFVLELISTPTTVNGLHSVKGMIIFLDLSDNEHEVGSVEVKVEGVYIWPFRKLRVVAYRGEAGEFGHEKDFICNPYHKLGVFTSQMFEESLWDKIWKRKNSPPHAMEKHCRMELAAHVSLVPPSWQSNGVRYHLDGSMESISVDDDGDCLQTMQLNSTSMNTDMYFLKEMNYNLLVIFISFLQVLLLLQQLSHSSSEFAVGRVSILTIGQQTIMDAYLCALHLVAGIAADSLFCAFATAAFMKFVIFFYFERKYIEAIWKVNGLPAMGRRHDLAVPYSLLCGTFMGGILVMYMFQKFLPFILLLVHSFWMPQIVINVVRDRRGDLHPWYIIGMSVTRLVIPLYFFGCPHNFMQTKVDRHWCICLVVFVGLQALILLLQDYLGSGCAIFCKTLDYQ